MAAGPPSGFASDDRDENPRQYPPGTYPGHPGEDSYDDDEAAPKAPRGGTAVGPYQPPYGFAIDGRPENPRVFRSPPGPQGHPGSA